MILIFRMKKNISDALSDYEMENWQDEMFRHRWQYAIYLVQKSNMKWLYELSRWIPARNVSAECQPHRLRDRLALGWDYQLHDFCGQWTDIELFNMQQLVELEDRFVEYFR